MDYQARRRASAPATAMTMTGGPGYAAAPMAAVPASQPFIMAAPPVYGAPLPYGWEERCDPSGRVYYANHVTHETSWVRPVAPAPPAYEAPPAYHNYVAGR